jgi:chemotaxis protein CheD
VTSHQGAKPAGQGGSFSQGKRIHIIQGEYHVTDDPEVALATVLGSCVAACVRDPVAGVGGMNHFLLPGEMDRSGGQQAERDMVHIMELLLNGLFKRGAQRSRLEAKLFGGANMFNGLTDIGAKNAAFAEQFLRHEGVSVLGGSLGGRSGRRVEYWPVSGRARAQMIAGNVDRLTAPKPAVVQPAASTGEVELF